MTPRLVHRRIFFLKGGLLAALGLAWLGVEPAPAKAQADRYELGRRLRRFEFEWDKVEDVSARTKASLSLKAAVNAFFSFRLGEAGKAIGEAQFALRKGQEPTEVERWAESLVVRPEGRLIDASTTELPVTIAFFYTTTLSKPEGASIRLSLEGSAGSTVEAPIVALPMTLSLPLKQPGAGDHVLKPELVVGNQVIPLGPQTISLADNLDDRIIALKKVMDAWPDDPDSLTTDGESAKGQLRLVESLAAKQTLEADFPAFQILANLEDQTAAADQNDPYLGQSRPGQFWVTLITKSGRKVPARIFVPELSKADIEKGKAMPLVVALHGAGGSENMFFETYGHGAIVDRCRERGWLLIAPRSTAFGGVPVAEVVDALAKIYPIDMDKVMLVGHSMGAGQAVAAGSSTPSKFAAVAALGGGGLIRPSTNLKALPFFVGVGTEDFAQDDASALADRLKKAEVANVIYREYPEIEHLAIVQVALADVFKFFDSIVAKPQKQ
jgi:predicted esterase